MFQSLQKEKAIYVDDYNSFIVKPARYDLFQRVAWNVNDTWLCMTAPNSVTGLDGKATSEWGYLLLRPCVINNPNQQWVLILYDDYTILIRGLNKVELL
ncbi:hypothetical protein H710_01103 [Bartonella bacilliformis Ver097]|uniref:Ricin B lectin domain-containing protein n=1 Tax=Bartonella bacilliformis Ver097 TaxID=1293911 RepID=A0A072R106_BARBA|nr:hypothetical protein H710_01103 [Bartonella bacilliformis Ver097]